MLGRLRGGGGEGGTPLDGCFLVEEEEVGMIIVKGWLQREAREIGFNETRLETL